MYWIYQLPFTQTKMLDEYSNKPCRTTLNMEDNGVHYYDFEHGRQWCALLLLILRTSGACGLCRLFCTISGVKINGHEHTEEHREYSKSLCFSAWDPSGFFPTDMNVFLAPSHADVIQRLFLINWIGSGKYDKGLLWMMWRWAAWSWACWWLLLCLLSYFMGLTMLGYKALQYLDFLRHCWQIWQRPALSKQSRLPAFTMLVLCQCARSHYRTKTLMLMAYVLVKKVQSQRLCYQEQTLLQKLLFIWNKTSLQL